jgi:hypothetical protein
MKAIVLNSADDLGNPGPDYKFGYGRINALRAVKYLEDGRYASGTISQGGTNIHTFAVPAGTAQLKVMVYWNDYEAAANASTALVNNLNMMVSDPSNATYNPWVLDATPNATALNQNATRKVDNLNNAEQVTIDTPSAGNYTVTVTAPTVPQGPQTYYVVYEFVKDEITVTYPIGGEGFAQGGGETIRWDAFGSAGNFTLDYSTDNGSTWSNISSAISGSQRYYTWTIPTTITNTGRGLIRVNRGSASDVSDANFSFIRIPTGLAVDTACPTAFHLKWTAVAGATGYEASILGTKYMDSVGTTTTTGFWYFNTLSTDTYWVSVRALGPNNAEGRRANAIVKNPGTFGNCTGVSVQEISADNGLLVFPNPANELFYVYLPKTNGFVGLKLYDIMGKEIFSDQWQNKSGPFKTQINVSRFSKGTHLLEVVSGGKQFHQLVGW